MPSPLDRDDLLEIQRDIGIDQLHLSGATLARLHEVARTSNVDVTMLFRDIIADALELADENDGDYYAGDDEEPEEELKEAPAEPEEVNFAADSCTPSPYLIDYRSLMVDTLASAAAAAEASSIRDQFAATNLAAPQACSGCTCRRHYHL